MTTCGGDKCREYLNGNWVNIPNVELMESRISPGVVQYNETFMWILGGQGSGTTELFNSVTNEITEHTPLPDQAGAVTAIRINETHIFVMDGEPDPFQRSWIYNQEREEFTSEPFTLSNPSISREMAVAGQITYPNGTRAVFLNER